MRKMERVGLTMLATMALTALLAVSPFFLNASDAWSDPYTDPVRGERVPLQEHELKSAVHGLKADVSLSWWLMRVARITTSVTARNPGPGWLRFVRVDVVLDDEAKIGRHQYTSLVFTALKPGETVTLVNNQLWTPLMPGDMSRVRYKASAQVVGGTRLVTSVKRDEGHH